MNIISPFREQFPVLQQYFEGKPLVYLDNAATTQLPQKVIDVLTQYYQHEHANVHRGVYRLSEQATLRYEGVRQQIQHFLNADSTEEIIFTKGATEAINLVAHSFLRPQLKEGDEILISLMEHHSNLLPWQQLCQETGAKLTVLPFDQQGDLQLEMLEERLTPRCKMLAINHISNVLGTINPIQRVIQQAREKKIPVLVDGAQAIAHTSVDVQALDCDFYVFSGHKAFGPTGIGVLYGKEEHLEKMSPYQTGGSMVLSVSLEKSKFQKPPHKFEAGTPNTAGVLGLASALEILQNTRHQAFQEHEQALLQKAQEELSKVPGLKILGNPQKRIPLFSFVMKGIHPHDIASLLSEDQIAVRAGHHCAMPLLRHLGVSATVRASFAAYNLLEEIDRLVESLQKIREIFNP